MLGIHIDVAVDNKGDVAEDVPLAPWH